MPDIWTHELPMRWADLDLLNHVTNVVYLDYAAEAQAVLVRDGHLEPARPVRDVTVTYLRPIALSSRPLLLRARLDDDVLTQEVCTTADVEPAVHASIVSTFGVPDHPPLPPDDGETLEARVRMTDLGASSVVSVAGQFRLSQESRILHFARMGRDALGRFVVGRIALQPFAPIVWQPEPLKAHSQITRVGNASFTIETTLFDDERALFSSQSTLVGFDRETQASRPFAVSERDHLLAHCR